MEAQAARVHALIAKADSWVCTKAGYRATYTKQDSGQRCTELVSTAELAACDARLPAVMAYVLGVRPLRNVDHVHGDTLRAQLALWNTPLTLVDSYKVHHRVAEITAITEVRDCDAVVKGLVYSIVTCCAENTPPLEIVKDDVLSLTFAVPVVELDRAFPDWLHRFQLAAALGLTRPEQGRFVCPMAPLFKPTIGQNLPAVLLA